MVFSSASPGAAQKNACACPKATETALHYWTAGAAAGDEVATMAGKMVMLQGRWPPERGQPEHRWVASATAAAPAGPTTEATRYRVGVTRSCRFESTSRAGKWCSRDVPAAGAKMVHQRLPERGHLH